MVLNGSPLRPTAPSQDFVGTAGGQTDSPTCVPTLPVDPWFPRPDGSLFSIGGEGLPPDYCLFPDPDPNPQPQPGPWSEVFDLPFEVIHAHLLPTGKVLFWGHHGDTFIWDPVWRNFETPAQPDYDTYCSGHAFLSDGKLLVSGGHVHGGESLSALSSYDPIADTWQPGLPMNDGRCYPTNTTLPNGDILTISGEASDGLGQNLIPQVWQNDSQTWRDLTNSVRELPDYPFSYLAPDGRVFEAGPNADTAYIETAGAGNWSPVGNTRYGLERDHGSSVTFGPGQIMIVGGDDPPTSSAELISLYSPAPSWQLTRPMFFPRRHLTAMVLPNGMVLAVGGTSAPGFNNPDGQVLTPELWNPQTGRWATLANLQFPRLYHSIALLLPDGRVLLAGGDVNDGSGSTWNAEVYSPPYMFWGVRPRITAAPTEIDYGESFFVGTREAEQIKQVSLIRLGSVTHGFNQNQGIAPLGFTAEWGGLRAYGLTDPNVTPPGYYMLFIVDDGGIPSEAKIIRLRDESGPRVVAATLLRPRRSAAQIAITFSEPLEPNRANDFLNYEVRVAGRDKLFKSADDAILTLQAVRYDKSASAVVLTLPPRLPRRAALMLTVGGRPVAGITDLLGHYLDGNGDGTPGDDFETLFRATRRRR